MILIHSDDRLHPRWRVAQLFAEAVPKSHAKVLKIERLVTPVPRPTGAPGHPGAPARGGPPGMTGEGEMAGFGHENGENMGRKMGISPGKMVRFGERWFERSKNAGCKVRFSLAELE